MTRLDWQVASAVAGLVATAAVLIWVGIGLAD